MNATLPQTTKQTTNQGKLFQTFPLGTSQHLNAWPTVEQRKNGATLKAPPSLQQFRKRPNTPHRNHNDYYQIATRKIHIIMNASYMILTAPGQDRQII